MCSHELPQSIILRHSEPRLAKSAERIEGAMIAGGDMACVFRERTCFRVHKNFGDRYASSSEADRNKMSTLNLSSQPAPSIKHFFISEA